MAVMAMADLATDMARGLLTPMLTTADTAMAVMAMADSDTDTARGLLMPTMEATAMAVLATAMVLMATASNSTFVDKIHQPLHTLNLLSRSQSVIRKIKL